MKLQRNEVARLKKTHLPMFAPSFSSSSFMRFAIEPTSFPPKDKRVKNKGIGLQIAYVKANTTDHGQTFWRLFSTRSCFHKPSKLDVVFCHASLAISRSRVLALKFLSKDLCYEGFPSDFIFHACGEIKCCVKSGIFFSPGVPCDFMFALPASSTKVFLQPNSVGLLLNGRPTIRNLS